MNTSSNKAKIVALKTLNHSLKAKAMEIIIAPTDFELLDVYCDTIRDNEIKIIELESPLSIPQAIERHLKSALGMLLEEKESLVIELERCSDDIAEYNNVTSCINIQNSMINKIRSIIGKEVC